MNQELQKKIKSSNKQEKQSLVEDIFSNISEGYDFMNDLMSLGLHRIWKKEFLKLIYIGKNFRLLDLATGSGDLLKFAENNSSCFCVGFDSNIKMIRQAQKKIHAENVAFVNGRAEDIPLRAQSFDAVTVSFGLRNFSDIDKSLREIKRVLKKGGKFYCLEFSQINGRVLRKLFHMYSKIIPMYGKLILGNKGAYSYLIDSIEKFPNQIELTKKLVASGFRNIEVIDILDGIAAIHISES